MMSLSASQVLLSVVITVTLRLACWPHQAVHRQVGPQEAGLLQGQGCRVVGGHCPILPALLSQCKLVEVAAWA